MESGRLHGRTTTDLDDLDYTIIGLLQENARISSREMAKRIGDVSDRVVRYRIKRLVERNVIFLQAIVKHDLRHEGDPG